MDKKIMIVDDEQDVLFSLKTIFEHQHFVVVTAKNGKECLKELENGFKGILLIDLMMPGMDGWTTIYEIIRKGYDKNVLISIITGKGTRDYQKMSLLGSYIFDYLVKPFDIDQLIASVERCNKYFYARNR
ncbi:MAG: response regulator [Candidatus Thermoplasmatota archaeon]|jgi:DNA-binding response OmpR family regulator|nr:response regulator [Candidatus Thermoplasmatota archaeon]